jgi:hypothetical protein
VVAYRLLTGRPPHREPPLLGLLDGREPSLHVSLTVVCPELPARVALMLDACLSFSPSERPGTAELLRALHDTDVSIPSGLH